LASLIINQASFAVQDALATDLAQRIERFEPDVVVGLPTLASAVARKLGHARYAPLGTPRKVWYRDDLPAPLFRDDAASRNAFTASGEDPQKLVRQGTLQLQRASDSFLTQSPNIRYSIPISYALTDDHE
jgi:hypothetical protein